MKLISFDICLLRLFENIMQPGHSHWLIPADLENHSIVDIRWFTYLQCLNQFLFPRKAILSWNFVQWACRTKMINAGQKRVACCVTIEMWYSSVVGGGGVEWPGNDYQYLRFLWQLFLSFIGSFFNNNNKNLSGYARWIRTRNKIVSLSIKEKDILFQMCSFFALNLINQPKSVSNE